MTGNITVAKSWRELNDWQLSEIAHLYLNTPVEDFADAYLEMIKIVYQKTPEPASIKFLYKLLKEIPISELEKHTGFIRETNNHYRFLEIPGLIKPADKLGDVTARHFSTIDTYFFYWNKEKSLISLKRLVATLYRLKDNFDELDLIAVSKITDNLSEKQMSAIALAYLFSRRAIEDDFKIVFPKKKEETDEEKLQPVFTKKDAEFIPFDKALVGMAMDDKQPLGKKQDVNNVRIYEFLSVMSESIKYQQELEKQHKNAGK